jgi:hypothetical protein
MKKKNTNKRNTMKKQKSNASQQHGIDFENEIHLHTHGKSKVEYEKLIKGGYTAEHDIQKGILSDVNISVKTSKGNAIACGDVMRMFDITKREAFTILVGHYTQVGNKKHYNKISEFYITPDVYDRLWGKVKYKELKKYVDYVKSIPHGKEAQLKHQKIWRENIKSLKDKCGLMALRTKVDGKAQRRTQCSLNINDLLSSDINSKEYTYKYNGMKLPYIQKSAERTFN